MTDYRLTLTLSQEEAEALSRGEVPPAVQNTVIGLLVDVQETPAEAIETMARRRKERKGAAA